MVPQAFNSSTQEAKQLCHELEPSLPNMFRFHMVKPFFKHKKIEVVVPSHDNLLFDRLRNRYAEEIEWSECPSTALPQGMCMRKLPCVRAMQLT